jgi:hypothetical protein
VETKNNDDITRNHKGNRPTVLAGAVSAAEVKHQAKEDSSETFSLAGIRRPEDFRF